MASLNDLRKMNRLDCTALRAIYRAFRATAMNEGEAAATFDDHCVWEAKNRQFAKGIRHEVLIVDAAASQAVGKLTVRTRMVSPETREWSDWEDGGIIHDEQAAHAFIASHGWPV